MWLDRWARASQYHGHIDTRGPALVSALQGRPAQPRPACRFWLGPCSPAQFEVFPRGFPLVVLLPEPGWSLGLWPGVQVGGWWQSGALSARAHRGSGLG